MPKRRFLRQRKTLWRRISNYIKGLDLYGKSIVLTYEGDNSFKTHLGGVASFLIYWSLLSYFILQFRVLLLRNNTTFSKNSLQKELSTDTEVHNIGYDHIMFGIDIGYKGVNLLNDKSYFTYSLNQVSQVYVQSGSNVTTQRTKTALPTANWAINSFYNVNNNTFSKLSISEFLCPTVNNFTIAANFYAPRFDYIELKVYRWNPSTSSVVWKTNISDIMKETQLTFMVSNNYMDFSNYTEPVQNFLDDRFFWDLAPGLRKKVDIYVRKNSANFIDDFIQLGQSNSINFYQVNSMRESIVIEEPDLQVMSVFFRFDSNFDTYSRRVYSLGDLFGQTGGLYSAIFLIGAIIVGIFSERLFVSSILSKIYQIDQTRDEEIRKWVSENKGK